MAAKQKRRPANDRAFKKYKINNQREANKIKKLEKHLIRFPKDEQASKALKLILANGYPTKNVARGPKHKDSNVFCRVYNIVDLAFARDKMNIINDPLDRVPDYKKQLAKHPLLSHLSEAAIRSRLLNKPKVRHKKKR